MVRLLALLGMAVWLGGFTFYSAFVLPVLHEELGSLDAGHITGQVTNPLNAVGVATVIGWWILAGLERDLRGTWARRLRYGVLAVTTAILVVLIVLHPMLEARLDSGPRRSFYRWHQLYLIASTVQWGVNIALLAIAIWLWRDQGSVGSSEAPARSVE